MSIPKIIDNNRKSLLGLVEDVADQYKVISIATGYWDLPGTELILDKLKDYQKIRLLIGREPSIPREGREKVEPDFPEEDFYQDLQNIPLSKNYIEVVKTIKQWIDEGKLEVKVYKKSFLHAKCFIFGSYESENAIGIIGSSNFTRSGLTLNTELNAVESDHRIVTFKPQSNLQEVGHLFWFDQFWTDEGAVDWSGEFSELLSNSPVGDRLFSPYETYIKTLYEIYKEELEDENIQYSTDGQYTPYDFQIKNVNALLRRLKKYQVAMLSDSVGLGKTITAIEVIKKYLDSEEGKKRVEVICPKSLKRQWMKELHAQGVLHLTPTTLQNVNEIKEKEELDNIASVSLFVIDESHNLKNRSGKRFEELLQWIRNNPKADVLLLTATPINNQLTDITNQILLGSRGETDILKVTVIDKNKQTIQITFHDAVENLRKKINQDLKRDGTVDYDYIQQVMRPILRSFVVRRTRQGIQKEYGDLFDFPIVIPEVKKYGFDPYVAESIRKLGEDSPELTKIYRLFPDQIVEHTKDLKHPFDQLEKIESRIDTSELEKLSPIYFVYQIVLLLGFIPYRWKMYQSKYYGKTRQEIGEMKLSGNERKMLFLQLSIYGILRTMFLKRMESSVAAIKSSVNTYMRKLDVFEKGLNEGKIVSLADLNRIEELLGLSDEDVDPDEVEIEDDQILDEVSDTKYDIEAIRNDIKREKWLLDILSKQLDILEQDASKVKSFVELLTKIQHEQPAGSKVLVFSYYADTIAYLEKIIPQLTQLVTADNTGFITSKNRQDSENLAGRFAPKAKRYELQEGEKELDYLFSTDVLSEGQNLQDCGILINFDLHWNPVRMIQRNGRVNRLGSQFKKVFIYNISPDEKLEEYLRLVQRLEGKINLIRNTIGTDSPVLDEIENPLEFTDSLKDVYSEDLNARIRALEEAERDADMLLSEDEFVSDLKRFHTNPDIDQTYKDLVYRIPKGKWAVMPTTPHRGNKRPDVIVLNTLYDNESIVASHVFVHMDRMANNFQAVPMLQALEWLKTTSEDNQRATDNITIDKAQIAKATDERVEAYFEQEVQGSTVGQQTEVLRVMYENQYSQEDIEIVEKAFNSTNAFDKQKLAKLVRQIMRLKRENQPHLEKLQELVKVSTQQASYKNDDKLEYEEVKQSLFYVRDNK